MLIVERVVPREGAHVRLDADDLHLLVELLNQAQDALADSRPGSVAADRFWAITVMLASLEALDVAVSPWLHDGRDNGRT